MYTVYNLKDIYSILSLFSVLFTIGLMGIIFPEKFEEAYAGLRIAQGLGPAIAFGYSSEFCMETKIHIMIALCIVSLALYLLMEALLRRKQNKAVSKFKQTCVWKD